MKILSLLHGLFLGTTLFIVGPYLFYYFNSVFTLPVFTFQYSRIFGLIIIIGSILAYLYLNMLFLRNGKGTIIPSAPATNLITVGPYRFTRNPIYIIHFLYYLGLAIYHGHLMLFIYFLLTIPLYTIYLKFHEEPKLIHRFGTEYEEFMKIRPRWFWKK